MNPNGKKVTNILVIAENPPVHFGTFWKMSASKVAK